ncbi:unnamed protein product [Symbiodinium natans]|uniref:Uncharacterized protein n=1 Tax=Symbiodinium natans TaxID=878477 RepID=A0A812SYY0_9DINO|nr:unnamed protein product [Symbiodinium natans]
MASAALKVLILLVTQAGVVTGNLLDNFEWLKEHGDEALEAAAHCQNVVVQVSKLTEKCQVTNQLENFAAVVAWFAIDQTGHLGSDSLLADLARSPPALTMKAKAQQVILASTQASMDEVCSPGECNIRYHAEFFEAFAGCYAPSVCAASQLGTSNFHRCRSSLQSFVLNEMKKQAQSWCNKDESGIYCQQHASEMMLQSPMCYALYVQPVLDNGPHRRADACSHKECIAGWKQAEKHPTCSSTMNYLAKSRLKGMTKLLRQIWGAKQELILPSNGLTFSEACIDKQTDDVMV